MLFVALIAQPLLTSSAAASKGRTYTVERVFAGDILKLTNGKIVRLLGIDTPESQRDVEHTGLDLEVITNMGEEAKKYLADYISRLPNREVYLEFDVQRKDKYDKNGRLLAYVFWDTGYGKDGRHDVMAEPNQYFDYFDDKYMHFINATMVKAGYAMPMAIAPNVKYAKLFEDLHEEAKVHRRGLWKGVKGAMPSREEKEFYDDGTLKLHMVVYSEENSEGFWKEYHKDGSLKIEVNLLKIDGGCGDEGSIPIEGIAREFYESGQIKEVGEYRGNCEEGSHKYYSPEGLLEQELYFEGGRHLWTKRYKGNSGVYRLEYHE